MIPKRQLAINGLIALLLILFAFAIATQAQIDSTKVTTAKKSPVIFSGDTLFFINTRLGPFSAQDRAQAISLRLTKIAKNSLTHIDTLTISATETSTDILSGNLIIMTITDTDAAKAGSTRRQLANILNQKIYTALKEQAARTSLKSILLGILFTILATVVLILILKVMNKFFPKVYAKLYTLRGTRIRSLKIQKLEVLSANRITDLLIVIAKWLRVAGFLLLFYFYLSLILSFFRWTRGLAGTLFSYILSPFASIGDALVSYLPNIFFIAIIAIVTHYVIKITRWFFGQVEKGTIILPGFYQDWTEPTFKIVRFVAIAFTIIVIFPYLPGSDSPAFKGISVFLGVLFSSGSTSAIANLVAGIVLTYMGAFSLGDRVKIADTIGDIVKKTLLITRIRTIKNVDITIPNAMVLGSHIINFSSLSQERGLILHTTVTIGYDVPWRQVYELLIAAAQDTQNILVAPAPFVLQTSLNDFYVSDELNAHTDNPTGMAKIYSELDQNIQDQFNKAGIKIMSPHYAAIRNGNQTAIPENYLPKSYKAPGFRIFSSGNKFRADDQLTANKEN